MPAAVKDNAKPGSPRQTAEKRATATRATQKAFEKAEKAQRIKLAVAYSMLGIATVLFVIIFGGDRFAGVRDTIGLSRFMAEERGIYANCSRDPSDSRFCGVKSIDERMSRKNHSSYESEIDYKRRPGDFVPFRLSGDK